MKRLVDILPLIPPHSGLLHCSRCDKEFESTELMCGHRWNDSTLYWYCPTEDCNGRLDYGIYYVEVSS